MNLQFLMNCLAAVLMALISAPVGGEPVPSVRKVDPPSWWAGHTINPVRLLIRGENLGGAKVVSTRPEIKPSDVRVNDRGTALFVSVAIDPAASAGDAGLRLEGNGEAVTIPFRVDPPMAREVPATRGVGSDDVIYLIMIDRFANGDPANDRPPGSPVGLTDRRLGRAYHGGDLRGVIDHLDYLQSLGVTALWLTPWYENVNAIRECNEPWCPYSYYHGYHPTDHYAVEDHFGSLETIRALVEQAHRRGMKVIQDQISNHVSLSHPWVADPPLPAWFHGTPERHVPNTFQNFLLSSPHAPASERTKILDGWFSDDSPDLNQDEPEVARYLIQNAVWWVGMTGVDAVREDTAQFMPRPFLRDLTAALHRQFPGLTIVGEVLEFDPSHNCHFLGGRAGWDAIDTGLDSIFDFPTWATATQVFTGKAPMTELQRILRSDLLFPDAARMTTLTNNHDLPRFLSYPDANLANARLQVAYTLSIRGVPQIYYGDEIALPGGADPDNRLDFPGGFPGDPQDAFDPASRTPEQAQFWTWTRDWIALRRSHSSIRRGRLIDLDAQKETYLYARTDANETIVIALNRGDQPARITVPAANLQARDGMTLSPLLGGGEPIPAANGQFVFSLPPVSATAYELKTP